MMLELGQMLGLLAAVMLAVAVVAWAKLRWRPAQRAIGGREVDKPAPAELASQLLVLAFGLSALAAVVSAVGWIGL